MEKEVTLNFYHQGLRFDSLDDLMRVYKTAGITLDLMMKEYVCLNSDEPLYLQAIETIKNIYAEVERFEPKEVFQKFTNQEQKMCLLSYFSPEEIAQNLDSELVDKQTINKKQTKTVIKNKENQNDKTNIDNILVDDIELVDVEFEDTYELYRSDKSVLNTENDIFFVKCKDASHDKYYYLFIDPNSGDDVQNDAIAAIASTMRDDDGNPLTKKEYLELIKSET
jgi:hypothetical protein